MKGGGMHTFPQIRMVMTVVTFLILFFSPFLQSLAAHSYDVRRHLSTVTRYDAVKDVGDGCSPIHLNLVARHGTRSPTQHRIEELDELATRIESLVRDIKQQNLSLEKVPDWLRNWTSPWEGHQEDGELLSVGEEELYGIGIRTRDRYPELFDAKYHQDVYTINATQVPRASSSAVAFGMGLFSSRGSLGPGNHSAFAVISESRQSDILLRFFKCCEAYKAYKEEEKPNVKKLKQPIFDDIAASLKERHGLNFAGNDTSSLWFLCKQEASLLNITDQACGLFDSSEVELLEWTDDLELFKLKGYGNPLNYLMGVPLLKDVFESMEQAIEAKKANCPPGSYEKARLRFAHAETLVPFSCLLGLFLEESEYEQIQREQPLQAPPKPPEKRKWRGSTVAPFAGNNMLVLYSCPGNSTSNYFVQVLHNEHPVPMPGCNNSNLCPFEVFKEKIVTPHLKNEFNEVCRLKNEFNGVCNATSEKPRICNASEKPKAKPKHVEL